MPAVSYFTLPQWWERVRVRGIVVFLVLTYSFLPAFGAVVINEVLYDPQGSDAGSEWVELYNNGNVAVNLFGWVLQKDDNEVWSDSSTAVVANLSGVIGPGAYYLIEDVESATPQPSNALAISSTSGLGMSNNASKGQGLRLVDASDPSRFTVVDTLVYGSPDEDGLGAEGGAGSEAAAVKSASSLARIADGRDSNNNKADFLEDPTPTPKALNDPSGIARFDFAGTISYPNPFIPARHGSVTLSTPERVVSGLREIRIFNVAGDLVRTLRQSTWDGRNDDGAEVAPGLYYYVLETDRGKARGKVTLVR
jgi:hypothetical protein